MGKYRNYVNHWNHPTAVAGVEEQENPRTGKHIFAAIDTSGCDNGVIGIFDNFVDASNAVGEQEGFCDLWEKLH